ncbi:MAG: hypothetical protein WBX00_08310 [Isosphaeraceae bacterium]
MVSLGTGRRGKAPLGRARNLVDAWAYAVAHPEEIRAQIHANEAA